MKAAVLPSSLVFNKKEIHKNCTFFITVLIFAFRIISVDIYYMSISLYTDFYSPFASPDTCIRVLFLFLLFFSSLFFPFFFCCRSDYVLTFVFAGICEHVYSTKNKSKHQTGQPNLGRKKKKKRGRTKSFDPCWK